MTKISLLQGVATELKQDAQITNQIETNDKLDVLNLKDFATETSLQEIKTAINNIPETDITTLAKESKQLPDNHNVNVSNMPTSINVGNIPTDYAKESKQLANNHQVTVSNQITDYATETTLQAIENNTDGIETKQDTIISKLTDIDTSINNIELSVGDVDLNTDQLEAKADTTNSKLDTVISKQLPNNHDVTVTNIPTDYSTNTKLDEVITAVEAVGVNVNVEDSSKYAISGGPIEDTGYVYIGYQNKDGAWYIKRQNTTTSLWGYIKGTSDFATNWTNKTGLTYTDYDTTNGIPSAVGVITQDVHITDDQVGLAKELTLQSISTKLDGISTQLNTPLETIDNVHEHIHDGKSFYVFDVITLTAGSSYTLVVNTNDTVRKHSYLQAYMSEELEVISYEGVTTSNNGTPITILNRNRNSLNTSTAQVYHTPTGLNTTGATKIRHARVGSKNTFGETQQLNELVLKSNTKYSVVFTNRGNTTAYLNWQWFWYECEECE